MARRTVCLHPQYSLGTQVLTAAVIAGYVPTDGEASGGEEEEVCQAPHMLHPLSWLTTPALRLCRSRPTRKASTTVTLTRATSTTRMMTRRRRARTGMCVALLRCLLRSCLIACASQELEEEAKRADKTAYEEDDDDLRKRKGGAGGGGKGKPPPAKKSKY